MLTPLARLFGTPLLKTFSQHSIKFAFFYSLKGDDKNMFRGLSGQTSLYSTPNKKALSGIQNDSDDEQENSLGPKFSAKRYSEIEAILSKLLGRQFKFLSDNNPQVFGQVLPKFQGSYKNLESKELLLFIYFCCSRSYRGAYMEKIQKLCEELLLELKDRKTFSPFETESKDFVFFTEKIPQLLISLSNIALYDHELFDMYFKYLLSNQQTLLLEQSIMVKTALSLLWSVLKLRVDNPEGKNFLLRYIKISQQYFSVTNWLRLLWMCALDTEKNTELIKLSVENFLKRKREKESFSYNPKNCSQIRQCFFELYPECVNGEAPDKNNPFLEYYDQLKRLNHISSSISDFKDVNNHGAMSLARKSLSYIEKHSSDSKTSSITADRGFGTNYFILKDTNQHYSGKFEKSVEETLKKMELSSLQSNVHVGPYEIDFVVNNDTVLEINGGQHYVCEILKGSTVRQNKALLLQFDAKRRYLAAKGFKKLAIINHYEWDRADLKMVNKVRYIQKVLETAGDIKNSEGGAKIL